MIKLDKNGLTAPSITTGSITTGDTTISNFNQFIVKNKNGEIEETLCLGGNIRPALDGKKTFIDLGYDYNSRTGASIALRSIDYDNEPGSFSLIARDEENSADLRGYPNGELNWNSSKVVTDSDFSNFKQCVAVDATQNEFWIGYKQVDNGSRLFLFNDNNENFPGYFRLTTGPNSEDTRFSIVGKPDGSLSWDTFTFSTSYGTDCSYIRFSASDFMIQASGKESARLGLRGENNGGSFSITAKNSNATKSLSGYPDGTLTWDGSKVITNSGLAELENNLYFTDNNTNRGVGYKGLEGARIAFYSANNSNEADKGRFAIAAIGEDSAHSKYLVGKPDGTLTWNGSNIVTYAVLNRLDMGITWTTDNSRTSAPLGFSSSNGARLIFYNKNHTTWTGYFQLAADDGSASVSLVGKPDGTLTWDGQAIITNYNKTNIYFDHTLATSRDVGFSSGNNNTKRGAYITFKSGSDTSAAGCFTLTARDADSAVTLLGTPDGDLSWNGAFITPVGTIVAYAGTSVPAGWLYCGGGAVSRTTYAKLYSIIGTKYGTGDGSTTFNLPALQGRVLQGYTDSVAIGTKIAAGLPDIQGTVNFSAGNTGARLGLIRGASGAFAVSKTAQKNPSSVGDLSGVYEEFSFKASTYNTTYGKSTSVQPPALAIMYIIKYK